MRPVLIVDRHPLRRDLPNLVQAPKEIEVEHFIAIGPIEPFDKRILRGATWLDMINQYPVRLSPIKKALSEKLWPTSITSQIGRAVI